ncbi:MAG TPA: trigger factor [Sedimentisphaerales bacterium]|nr:trigger factor [Sedimentisphaerales bacterium]
MPEEEQQPVTAKNTVTIEEAGPCKKKVIIEIPEERIKSLADEQYETLRKEALVPGFRKGRAPRRLLEKRFGKETTEQIKLKLLAKASEAAIKDNKLDVLGEPDIDFEKVELPETGTVKFDFEVEVRPEFELPELEGIAVNKTRLEVTDEQVDRDIEQRLKWAGVWTPRQDEAVELDDQIIADAVLKVEGVEEEDKRDNIEIFVRPSGFVAGIPVEKLDELLVGAKAGQTRQTTVEVPRTYFREEYRGKKVDVEVQVKDVKWLKPAALNEDFFRRFGVEDEAELRENVRDVLHGRLEQQAREQMSEQIYKYLLDNTSFELPLDVVADHSTTLLKRQYVNLLMRGLPREQVDENMEQLRASSEEQAKEQLRTFFVMDKVAEKLQIEVSDEEINGHIAQLAIQRGQRPERMRENMERDGSLAQFRLQVREQKCVAKLLESAKITEVEPEKKKVEAKKTTKKTTKRTTSKAESPQKKTSPRRKTASKKKAQE